MLIIPAIDIMEGRVVRLKKGIMESPDVYLVNPADTAMLFQDMGVARIHIVDLDGARSGRAANFRIIEDIASRTSVKIEVGGGIRDMARLDEYMNCGAAFAILGTAAVRDRDFVAKAADKYPGGVILGVDAKKGVVLAEGWYEDTGTEASELVKSYAGVPIESVIFTDVEKDGMLGGLNTEAVKAMADVSPFPVIASGGISSPADVINLKALGHANIKGCIAGKAVYEGRLNLAELLEKI